MENQSTFQIEHYDTLAQLDALEKEWTVLIAGIPNAPVFLTWEWIRTWWVYWAQDRELWLLAARNQQGGLLGLAPMMIESYWLGLLKLRILAFIGTGLVYPVHLDIIANPSDQEAVSEALLEYLLSRSEQWDVISLTSIAHESSLHNLLSKAGVHIRIGSTITSPYIPLPDNWDTYSKTLSKKLRRNLKYFCSKLENDYPGSVIFSCITDPCELNDTMQKLEDLIRKRWHAQGLSTAFDDQTFANFHRTIAGTAIGCGWLRLYKLAVAEQVIALFYCFRFHDRVYAYAIGFDVDWSGYSPGRLLIAYGIQSSIHEGASELDWLAGNHDYKLAWTDCVRVEDEILFSCNWRGHLWVNWKCSKDVLITKAKKMLPQPTQNQIKRLLSSRHKSYAAQSNPD